MAKKSPLKLSNEGLSKERREKVAPRVHLPKNLLVHLRFESSFRISLNLIFRLNLNCVYTLGPPPQDQFNVI